MKRFCYKCGALETDKGPLTAGMCQDCFAINNPLFKTPFEVELKHCKSCGAYKVSGKWRECGANPEAILNRAIKDAVLAELKVAKLTATGVEYVPIDETDGIRVKIEPVPEPQTIARITVTGKIDEKRTEPRIEKDEVRVKISGTTCETCNRINGGYYEAVLQVRGEKEIPKEKLEEILVKLGEQAVRTHKDDRRQFIANMEMRREGVDIKTSSVALAKQMANTLKLEYGAETRESAKLFGQDKSGKRRYRVSVLARLPSGKK